MVGAERPARSVDSLCMTRNCSTLRCALRRRRTSNAWRGARWCPGTAGWG